MVGKKVFENDPYALVALVAHTQMDIGGFKADQMPVLSARVSHAGDDKTGQNPESDKKLMNFLAENKHMSVFEHQSVTFKIVCPLFVAREWHRHRTQSFNEISMRYTADPVGKFHKPNEWREQCSRNKQGSAGGLSQLSQNRCDEILKNAYDTALDSYEALIGEGAAREQARMVVPVGNYTEFYATANLRNWMQFYALRHTPEAQYEIRQYAIQIDEILSEIFPDSWGCLVSSLK